MKILYKVIKKDNKDENLFFTLKILNNLNININISFKNEYIINFNDIKNIIKMINDILNQINNNVIIDKNNKNFKYKKLLLDYKNNEIVTNEFTKINFYNMMINFKMKLI